MKFDIGDKVKFIDQEGQGTVTRIINANTVGVTTDGFELPFSITDLIKAGKPSSPAERLFYEGKGSYDLPGKDDAGKGSLGKTEPARTDGDLEERLPDEPATATDEEDARISPLRRSFGGKNPQSEGVYLAIVPSDQQFMLRGPMELFVVNYTPHTLLYNLATRGTDSFYGIDFASVPPYSKISVECIERDDLGLWAEGVLQGLFFQDESRQWPLPFSKDYKLRVNHVGRPENYVFPVFMQQKTLLVPMLDLAAHGKNESLPLHSGKGATESGTTGKPASNIVVDSKNPLQPYMIQKDVAEVDLHVEKLLKTRLEMKNAEEKDYLSRQLDVFETCLNQAIGQRLSRIIFIHGVGEGILKAEMEKKLKNYENLHFMAASTLKYGRGAIEVFIG